jgi:hypothetical protein
LDWISKGPEYTVGIKLQDFNLVCIDIDEPILADYLFRKLVLAQKFFDYRTPRVCHILYKLPADLADLESNSYTVFAGFKVELMTKTVAFLGQGYQAAPDMAYICRLCDKTSFDKLSNLPYFFYPFRKLRGLPKVNPVLTLENEYTFGNVGRSAITVEKMVGCHEQIIEQMVLVAKYAQKHELETEAGYEAMINELFYYWDKLGSVGLVDSTSASYLCETAFNKAAGAEEVSSKPKVNIYQTIAMFIEQQWAGTVCRVENSEAWLVYNGKYWERRQPEAVRDKVLK